MAKGKSNTTQRIEVWLPKRHLKYIKKYMTEKGNSRKQSIEDIIIGVVNISIEMDKGYKKAKKSLPQWENQ